MWLPKIGLGCVPRILVKVESLVVQAGMLGKGCYVVSVRIRLFLSVYLVIIAVSVTISFKILRVGYLGGLTDFTVCSHFHLWLDFVFPV